MENPQQKVAGFFSSLLYPTIVLQNPFLFDLGKGFC